MYVPAHFQEQRTEHLQKLVREYPLGTLVTLQAGSLHANHVPFEWDSDGSPQGTLRAHVARANPVWREFDRNVESLAVFQGAQAYISPSWYETKQQTGKVVPTFNYLVVHVHGSLRAIDDRAWLREFVERLTRKFEVPRTVPWAVSDAPEDFIEQQLGAIIGLEIAITRIQGKWKASQNRPQRDQRGVVAGLQDVGTEDALAMAAEIAARKAAME